MILEQLQLHNFCGLTRVDKLGPGVHGIIGPNGSGKTNWTKGLCKVLTGHSGNPDKAEKDITDGCDSGFVEGVFSLGDEKLVIKRHLSTSQSYMSFGDKKYQGSTKVAAALAPLVQVSGMSIIADVVFARQGNMTGALFGRPAERSAMFSGLFRLEHIEGLRERLAERIRGLSTGDRQGLILAAESEVLKLDADIGAVRAAIAEVEKDILEPSRAEEIRRGVMLRQEFMSAQSAKDVALRELGESEANLARLKQEYDKDCKDREEYSALVSQLQPQAEQAKQTVEHHHRMEAMANDKLRAQRELEFYVTSLETSRKNEPVRPAAAPSVLVEEAKRLDIVNDICRVVAKTDAGSATCFVCGGAFPAERRQKFLDGWPGILQEANELKRKLEDIAKVQEDYRQKRHAWEVTIKSAQALAEVCQGRLKAFGDVAVDQAAYTDAVEFLRRYTAAQNWLSRLEGKLPAVSRAIAGVEDTVRRFREAAARDVRPTLSQAEADAGQEQLTKSAAASELAAKHRGSLETLELRRTQQLAQLKRWKDEEAAAGSTEAKRELLEKVRIVLHRDHYPLAVFRRFLRRINSGLAKYLEELAAGFTAEIQPDLTIQVFLPDGATRPAHRLSGGQQVALGIAFRMAVYYLFARNLGLLVLDEPTAFLDDSRINQLVTLLDRIKGYSRLAGLQVIVVTHEKALSGVFDSVIQLP